MILRAALTAFLVAAVPAQAAPADGEAQFRALYKELVETNTTLSAGSCTIAAERMATRLKAAGYADSAIEIVVSPAFPKQGNLLATLPGSNPKLPALLLLAHIDVVEAKRADWERDPFTLVEEGGYFYARGASDDKAMAASFVDAMVRFKTEGFRPKRTIKLALTCGEETDETFNGVRYLLETKPDALKAGWALNEGARGALDAEGKPVSFGVQAGEKVYQDFTLTTTSPGGHSSRPAGPNAIAELARAIDRIDAYRFPVDLTEASKGFFGMSAKLYAGQTATDMAAIGAGTADDAAYDRISANPLWNPLLRTTCIVTQFTGGHATNAQPQKAVANINCRIIPGEAVTAVQAKLTELAANPKVTFALADKPGPTSPPPPLTPQIMKPITAIAGDMWPGVPVIPSLSSGATDGRFTNAAGIPTYGVSGMFGDPDGNGVHGLNERIRVKSLLDGRVFLYRLVKAYAE